MISAKVPVKREADIWQPIYIVAKCYDGWDKFIHRLNTRFVIFQMFMTVSIILFCYLFMKLSTDRWESMLQNDLIVQKMLRESSTEDIKKNNV